MNILLTGASGFLGKHIFKELSEHGNVHTLSRSADATFNVDLAIEQPELQDYDLVVHCAGKAHVVPKSDLEIKAFFDVNVNGTQNLLSGLEKLNNFPKSFVLISTVAVYGRNAGLMINEDSALNAQDPYGKSKVEAEKIVKEWCDNNGVTCAILRLPLLAGENPLGNLGAMINGMRKGYYFNIDGGKARKSIVMASDVAKIIPVTSKIGGVYNLTDGVHPSFKELSSIISQQLKKGNPMSIPLWFAKLVARFGNLLGKRAPIDTDKLEKITSSLTFDDSKARKILGWNPGKVLDNFIIK